MTLPQLFTRFRFSMKSLLLVVFVACMLFAWQGVRIRNIEKQRAAAAWWQQRGTYVTFEKNQVVSIQPYGDGISASDMDKLTLFPNLRMLFLQDMKLDDTALPQVTRLKRLEWLVLTDRDVTDNSISFISQLPNLRNLFLDGTQVTNGALPYLLKMEDLEYLNLQRTRVSNEAITKLRLALPKTKIDD